MTPRRGYDLALLGALAASVLLFLVPQFFFVRQSLYENLGLGQVGTELTLTNYKTLLTDRFYLAAFGRTLALSAAATVVGLLLAAPAAYYLARLRAAWVRWLIVLLLISSFVSIVVKVLGLTMLLGTNGPIPATLRLLTGGWWSLSLLHNGTAVVIGLVQYTLPLLVMLLFGVIQNIPVSLEEAALVHGASDWRLARRVLLPLAWPGLVTAGLISFNMNMGAFTSAVLLGGGNVLTVPVLIQRKIILEVDYPTAAALSVLLTLAVVLINLVALAIPSRSARAMQVAA
jgi:putative spermidine/putrescine transport system permease protein